MDEWTEIRRKVLVEKVSKRSILRDYGIGHQALERVLANPEPPGYQMTRARGKPVLGPFLGVIDEILDADREAPVKQRHTAKRIFERLRDEYGYTGCYSQVRTAVAAAKRSSREVFVPLSQPPGHAQFDFGEAVVEIAGVRCKAALGVITLPYSDTYFLSAYPRECTETFQAAHVAGFEFFGAVPVRTSYDNTTIAVSKVLGRDRVLTRAFLALQSHYLFDHHFCRVGRGNEKGHVENHVGYSRRNLLVPVPTFASWAALNEYLAACCFADLNRRVRGKVGTKADRLAEDLAAMLALPPEAFEPRRVAKAQVNSLSLVRFDRNDYSVPTAQAHHEVTVVGGIEEVVITSGTHVVATHPRQWGTEHTTYDPLHYLALLEAKPGALDFARPLESWELPGCFHLLRRRLEADLGHHGTREYIKVLRLLERSSVKALARAIERALAIGATSADAIALIALHQEERPVGLFSLDGHPHLKAYGIDPPDLSAYRVLTHEVTVP
jgi:transposase